MAKEFHYADYIIFATSVVVSIGIGVYYAFTGGRQRTNFEYLLGSRTMKSVPVAISLLVSVESSVMMLGFPAEVYTYGYMFCLHLVMFLFAMAAAGRLVVPIIHNLQITSLYEYLELRFKSRLVRKLGSSLALLNTILYLGIVLLGPSLAIQGVLGFPLVWSMGIVSAASVLYTSMGGYKAVVWTDVFQATIMFIGVFAILIKGTIEVGGVQEVLKLNREGGRLDLWNFDPDPTVRHTFWSLMIGGFFQVLTLALKQDSMQRISSLSSLKNAQRVMYCVGPIFMITIGITASEGLVAFAYYSKIGCDPFAAEQITNPNQIIPYFVLDLFSNLPGMPGLFMAALFSASLSTLSSGYSALSAQITEDYLVPIFNIKSESWKAMIAKLSVVICGIISVAVSIIFTFVGGSLIQMVFSITGVFAGAVTGLLVFAVMCPDGEKIGAVIGVICSVAFTLWVALGKVSSPTLMNTPTLPPAAVNNCPAINYTISPLNYTINKLHSIEAFQYYTPEGLDQLYSLSYLWMPALSAVKVIVVGFVVSSVIGCNPKEEKDNKYVYSVSLYDEFCCCLPEVVYSVFRKESSKNKTHHLPPRKTVEVDTAVTNEKKPEMNSTHDDVNYTPLQNTRL